MQDLETFNNAGFDRGAGSPKEFAWLMLRSFFFQHSVMPWYRLRRFILKRFGATISENVVVKPGAKVTFPWKLSIGKNSWIGEDAWLLNLDTITIGDNVVISQRALLCTGSHNWAKESFDLITKPIIIEDSAWICADVFIGPGVRIGEGCVVTAGSVVTKDLPPNMICSGNPCAPVKKRREA